MPRHHDSTAPELDTRPDGVVAGRHGLRHVEATPIGDGRYRLDAAIRGMPADLDDFDGGEEALRDRLEDWLWGASAEAPVPGRPASD